MLDPGSVGILIAVTAFASIAATLALIALAMRQADDANAKQFVVRLADHRRERVEKKRQALYDEQEHDGRP